MRPLLCIYIDKNLLEFLKVISEVSLENDDKMNKQEQDVTFSSYKTVYNK